MSNEMKVDGACYCREVTINGTVSADKIIACHCSDCQKFSGAPFRAVAVMSAEQVAISGEIKEYLKIEYNIKQIEFQREILEFEGVEWNKSVKIKGKSARYIWIDKEVFSNDLRTKYKMANDDDDVLEIDIDDVEDYAFDSDSEHDI